jgi:hypothetical protein
MLWEQIGRNQQANGSMMGGRIARTKTIESKEE